MRIGSPKIIVSVREMVETSRWCVQEARCGRVGPDGHEESHVGCVVCVWCEASVCVEQLVLVLWSLSENVKVRWCESGLW